MLKKLTVAVAALLLIAVGSAGAVADGRIIHVTSGDRIVVNKNLSCSVASGGIVCGGATRAHLNAEIRSDGQVVVLAQPTPHGVSPVLTIKRAACGKPGAPCDLVVGTP
jgi:hypothetical protein